MQSVTAQKSAGAGSARSGMITARALEAAAIQAKSLGKDIWLTDPGSRGLGRFTVRCTPSGARVCMYRYTRRDGSRDILKVAAYDPRGISGMTLHEAREKGIADSYATHYGEGGDRDSRPARGLWGALRPVREPSA